MWMKSLSSMDDATTLSIKGLISTLSICSTQDEQHWASRVNYAQCHYANIRLFYWYAKCHLAKCHNACLSGWVWENKWKTTRSWVWSPAWANCHKCDNTIWIKMCHYTNCHIFIAMLNVVEPNVVMLSVMAAHADLETLSQGILIDEEGSVQLTSSLRYLVLPKSK